MLHGLSRGIISRIQGGSFKAGFMSGLSSAFDIGTKAFGIGAGGFNGNGHCRRYRLCSWWNEKIIKIDKISLSPDIIRKITLDPKDLQ